MAFFTLEDKTGEIECIVFPKKYNELYHHVHVDAAIAIDGTISLKDEEAPKILVNNILALQENKAYKNRETVQKESVEPAAVTSNEVKSSEQSAQIDAARFSMYMSMYTGVTSAPAPASPTRTPAQTSAPMQSTRADAQKLVAAQEQGGQKAIPQKIYLRVPDMSGEAFKKAKNIVDIFNEGTIRVIFYDQSTAKYSEYSERMFYSEVAIKELKKILGDDNVVVKYKSRTV